VDVESPLLRLRLPDGKSATLLVGDASTVLSLEDRRVSSWDLAGRPYALVGEHGTCRRGLGGSLLLKSDPAAGEPRVRCRLSPGEGEFLVERARQEAALARDALAASPSRPPYEKTRGEATRAEARRRLDLVVAMDPAALARDARRFLEVCGPVGILPPDRYLSLVVRVTEGCAWNACTFCHLYRGVAFRAKSPPELRRHLAGLRDYFGESVSLRRGVFLGDANALCLSHQRLLPLLETVAADRPREPLFSFVDAWTGRRKTVDEWRTYADLGLRRVYLGLETGDPELLSWLGKPGSPEDAVGLVRSLHGAGVAAGVIVLVGAGGERFAPAHEGRTADVLSRMELGPEDIVYYSDLAEVEDAATPGTDPAVAPLSPEGRKLQREAIRARVSSAAGIASARSAIYDVREFVY
jgi:Radical SAM superfamily